MSSLVSGEGRVSEKRGEWRGVSGDGEGETGEGRLERGSGEGEWRE